MTTTSNRLVRWGGARLSRRLSKSIPFVGALVALATLAGTVRRKGMIGGAFDTALNAVPFIGAAKNAVEIVRGRDFLPDRHPARTRVEGALRRRYRPTTSQPAQ